MSDLTISSLTVGTVVIATETSIANITPNKKYIVEATDDSVVYIRNDKGYVSWYPSHLFIEADVFYTISLWLTIIKLLEIDPKDL